MSRLHISTRDDAPVESKPILDVVYQKLGVVPNFYRLIGSSPVALAAFAAFQDGLSTTLDSKNRERIAMVVAQVNGSNYCNDPAKPAQVKRLRDGFIKAAESAAKCSSRSWSNRV